VGRTLAKAFSVKGSSAGLLLHLHTQRVADLSKQKVIRILSFLAFASIAMAAATSRRKLDFSHIVKLDYNNYSQWRLQVTLMLQSLELWDVVSGTSIRHDTDQVLQAAWDKLDVEALAAIIPTLSMHQVTHIYACTTAK